MKRSNKSASRALPLLLAGAGAGFLFWSLRRIDFSGLSVVISGGSRGLGLELARQFCRQGAKLALLARDADELERARVAPAKPSDNAVNTGGESSSLASPSILTQPGDRAIEPNNER